MTWVLYAGYRDRETAEAVFGELLEMGIGSEDLSLILSATHSAELEKRTARRMVDSGQTHLDEVRLGPGRLQAEGFEGIESKIGGGIGTNTFNDDVSGIQEMDEGQDAAEDESEPLDGRSYETTDTADARHFAAHGMMDSTRPSGPSFGNARRSTRGLQGESEYSIEVLGNLTILGDGPLASEMLTTTLQNPGLPPEGLLKLGLYRCGVASEEDVALVRVMEAGGAVLAVTESPGRIALDRLEALVEERGGTLVRTLLESGS